MSGDVVDVASELTRRYTEAFVRAVTDRMGGVSAIVCRECAEDIPEARRRAAPGCNMCISCTEAEERLAKRN